MNILVIPTFADLYGQEFLNELQNRAARRGMTDDDVAFMEYLNYRLARRGLRARFAFIKKRGAGFQSELAKRVKRDECHEAHHELCKSNWCRFLNERKNKTFHVE